MPRGDRAPAAVSTCHSHARAVAPPDGGERGELPPYGWTSKNYIICVCFHCHGTSSYHKTNTKPYKFPMRCSKCVSFWGTSYSRPPIDPYLTPPPLPLQNPGGATHAHRRRLMWSTTMHCGQGRISAGGGKLGSCPGPP